MDDPKAEVPGSPQYGLPPTEHNGSPAQGRPLGEGMAPPFIVRVFIGPSGIRSGWRLLLFLMIAGISGLALGAVLRATGLRTRVGAGFSPIQALLGEGTAFLALLFSAAVMAKLEVRTFADYALPLRRAFGAQFWRGALWGSLAVTLLLLLMRALHGFTFGDVELHGASLASYGILWALAFTTVGLLEEFLFRGYALSTLTGSIGFWPAAVLLSVLFGGLHLNNAGENWAGGLAAGLVGLFFCFTVRRTGTLWFAIGLHAAWDYSESFLYSVPDSGAMVQGHLLNSSFHGPAWLTGGSVGPEGSVLVFLVIGAMFVVFHRLYPDVRFPLAAPVPLSAPSSASPSIPDNRPSTTNP